MVYSHIEYISWVEFTINNFVSFMKYNYEIKTKNKSPEGLFSSPDIQQ